MRIPAFTADSSLSRAPGARLRARPTRGGAAIDRSAASNRVVAQLQFGGSGPNYVCTPDGKACACSGFLDCIECIRDPQACGGLGCSCNPRTASCGCSLHAL